MLAPQMAQAAPIITPGKISSPYITAGEATIEARGGYAFNYDNARYAFENRVGADYSFTNYFRLETDGRSSAVNGQGLEYTATSVAGKFAFAPKNAWPVDLGAKFTYVMADDPGLPDQVEMRLLAGKEIGTWKLGFNYKLSKDTGGDAVAKWGSGFSAGAYKSFGSFFAGPEYYADLGQFRAHQDFQEQSHYVGVQAGYKFQLPDSKKSLSFKLDYYQGITDAAADGAVRYQIDFNF